MASSTRSSSTSHARTCCVIIWPRANSICMCNSLTGMILILPETGVPLGALSAWTQSAYRLLLWLMSHGRLPLSDKLPAGMDAQHKTGTNKTTGFRFGMSILGLICVLLALVATLLFVLFLFQRRDLRAVSELSLQIQRAIAGERLPQRIELNPEHEGVLDVQGLGVSVNQLLMRASRNSGREKAGPKLFTELGERIHEAVLVHRDVILYANSQFATFVGAERVDLIDRTLAELVAPEYAELVAENLRRRLSGAHGPDRFEVEIVGLQGQV